MWRGGGMEIASRTMNGGQLRADVWRALENRRLGNHGLNAKYLTSRHDPTKRVVSTPTVRLTQAPAADPEAGADA